ncbi:MAG TPA: TonB-dependent receptor [Acidobacteriota bacterium]|nr:TonB-dependent receptor [Acidobacteriota bacterium]
MSGSKHWIWMLPVVLFVLTLSVFGQATDGAINGKVLDESGAVISGATVTVKHSETGFQTTATSDEQGQFRLNYLPVGKYIVTTEATGFKTTEVSNIAVILNQAIDLTIRLQTGEVNEVVTVSGGDVLVETSTSTLGNTFESRKVVELPSLNNSQLELALLAPNTTSQAGGTAGEGGSVGGNRPRNNSFTLDGVDNNDTILTGHVIDVIPEAVAEFTLLTNQYTAEFGHSSAGQFNTITKSGTNEFHGGASWFNINKNYIAVDHLTKEAIARGDQPDKKPRYDFNRIAGFLGGPVIKNKLFFFGAYQYNTTGTAGAPVSFLTPTAAGFAQLGSLSGVSPFTLGLLQQYTVPASSQSDSVRVLGKDIPVGTVNFLNPNYLANHTFNVNVDQLLGADQIRYRYNYAKSTAPNAGVGNPIFNGNFTQLNQLASVTYIHSFTPTLVNEARIAYRRKNNSFGVPDEFKSFANISFNDLGYIFGPQPESPSGEITNSYQLVNNLSWINGRHNLKFGVELRNVISANSFLPRNRGEYDYATLEEYLLDRKPTGFNGGLKGVGTSVFAANRKSIYWFVQDDFKISPTLTLNLGLRYEFYTIFRDEKLQALNAIASVPGVIEFREPKPDKNNFAPRIGLAWSPSFSNRIGRMVFGENGHSSIRAGFGMSYDVAYGNLGTLQLPPQFQQELSSAGGEGGPYGTSTNFLQNGGLGNTPIPPTTPADARAATQAFIPDKVLPYTMSWSLSYQRQLSNDWGVELRYLGTRGVKQFAQIRSNGGNVPFAIAGFSLPTYLNASQVPDANTRDTMPTLDQLLASSVYGTGVGGLGVADFSTPIVSQFLPVGSSTYHAASIDVTKRLSRGYTMSAAYTFSHTIDFGTNDLFTSFINPRRAQDGFNLGDMRGNSALDRPHRFVTSIIWELPWFRRNQNRLVRTLLGGFQFNTIYTAESGQPFTALSATDSNLNADTAGDRALRNPNGIKGTGSNVTSILNSRGQVVGYLATNGNAEYIKAGLGVQPTAGANTLRSPGTNNFDISIFKDFEIREGWRLQFRTEMFNAFNHEQLTVGGGSVFQLLTNARNLSYANVSSPTFNDSRIFAGRPRVIQFGLKLIF